MAKSDPPTPEPPAEGNQAQAEFANYKTRVQQTDASAGGGPTFASPLQTSAIPAWSLGPAPPAPGPAMGPGPWGPGTPGGANTASIVQGFGNTIRLGVEVLNAALSSSISMMNGVAWGQDSCGCDDCCDCCGPPAYDCCSVMGCGCGCCEPSVGSCC
jgi:hypothetical protein